VLIWADFNRIETILEIAGEGGSIKLQGLRGVDGTWQFRVTKNEAALWDFLDEDPDGAADPSEPKKLPPWASWDYALDQLNFYPWPRLSPIQVHAEFADRVLEAVGAHEEGGPKQVDRWREVVREGIP